MSRNSLFSDPDLDFWLHPDPDSMNIDPKHWFWTISNELICPLKWSTGRAKESSGLKSLWTVPLIVRCPRRVWSNRSRTCHWRTRRRRNPTTQPQLTRTMRWEHWCYGLHPELGTRYRCSRSPSWRLTSVWGWWGAYVWLRGTKWTANGLLE